MAARQERQGQTPSDKRKVEAFDFVDLRTLRLASFFQVSQRASHMHYARLSIVGFAIAVSACDTPTAADTVALGDNFESPEISIDEDFFHCEIQPNVISAQSCAEGGSGDGGGCHSQKSALRLVPVQTPTRCQNGRVVGAPSSESEVNLERVRATLGVDADASPFYRRPLGLDSHPRVIFDARSPEAELIRRWLAGSDT